MLENPRYGRYRFALAPVATFSWLHSGVATAGRTGGEVGERQVVLLYPGVLAPRAGTDILHAKDDRWSHLSLDAQTILGGGRVWIIVGDGVNARRGRGQCVSEG